MNIPTIEEFKNVVKSKKGKYHLLLNGIDAYFYCKDKFFICYDYNFEYYMTKLFEMMKGSNENENETKKQ